MDLTEVLGKVALFYVPFLFALCFHEFAHGWTAKKLGDPTAEMLGRVSLNPLVHMDLFGTVIFPLMAVIGSSPLFFGWAKPVPVSVNNLKDPSKDMFWIALAGPASNFFLAIVGFLLMGFKNFMPITPELSSVIREILQMFIILNLFLAVFNLIPLHPLDGGKILARFLPLRANIWLEQNSGTLSMVLFGLIIFDAIGGGTLKIITTPVYFIYDILATLTGLLFMLF